MTAKTLSLPSKNSSLISDALIVLSSSILLGLSGQASLPLPFTPVPIVLQVTLVLLLSVLFGPKRGGLIVLSLLTQAALGLPVLAGGAGGLPIFFGPRGGYLIGYLAASVLTGWLAERSRERTVSSALQSMAAGNALVYLCGAAYLSTFVGFKQALLLGVAPFILGDIIKIIASLKFLQWTGWCKK